MPEAAKMRFISNQMLLNHEVAPTAEKCGYSVRISSRVLKPGDTFAADVSYFLIYIYWSDYYFEIF